MGKLRSHCIIPIHVFSCTATSAASFPHSAKSLEGIRMTLTLKLDNLRSTSKDGRASFVNQPWGFGSKNRDRDINSDENIPACLVLR